MKRHRIFELDFAVRVKYGRKIFATRSGPMRLWVGPTVASAAVLGLPPISGSKPSTAFTSWRRSGAILGRWWRQFTRPGMYGFGGQSFSLGVSGLHNTKRPLMDPFLN